MKFIYTNRFINSIKSKQFITRSTPAVNYLSLYDDSSEYLSTSIYSEYKRKKNDINKALCMHSAFHFVRKVNYDMSKS